MEWKFGFAKINKKDVKWLKKFTTKHPKCTGYAVTANPDGKALLPLLHTDPARESRTQVATS